MITKYTVLEAHHRRLWLFIIAVVLFSLIAAAYAASLSLTGKAASFLAFYGFIVRLGSVVLLSVYVILQESKALESHAAAMQLSLPISRSTYLLQKYLAYLVLIGITQFLVSLPLGFNAISLTTLSVWSLSLAAELLICVSLALLLTVLFRQPLLSLSVWGAFYLFARSSGEFYRHSSFILSQEPDGGQWVVATLVKFSTLLVPKLEQFAAAGWLLYNDTSEFAGAVVIAQTLIYTALLFLLAVQHLPRRQF